MEGSQQMEPGFLGAAAGLYDNATMGRHLKENMGFFGVKETVAEDLWRSGAARWKREDERRLHGGLGKARSKQGGCFVVDGLRGGKVLSSS